MKTSRDTPSRRDAFKAMTGLVLAAALPAAAQAKAAKSTVQYQDQPKGAQRCSGCVQFVPPASCKVVAGEISPNGWCMAYVTKR